MTPPAARRRLLLFGLSRLDDMLAKGNLGYVRHYERYFDEVHVAYLRGASAAPHVLGHTRFVSLGGRSGDIADLLLAPLRLLRFARHVHPTSYLTADLVFSWWTAALLRWRLRARIVLMPVALPESIYASTGRSLHGLPIWLERALWRLSFRRASAIITSANTAAVERWLQTEPSTRGKVRVTAALVEEYPPVAFYDAPARDAVNRGAVPALLYVGRLDGEKKAGDLIEMMGVLKQRGIDASLHLAGDGRERSAMAARAAALGVQERVVFHGALPHDALVPLYRSATVFVSTVTGTALREAGLLGVPIVAYALDWVADLLRDGENAFLARPGDPVDLAGKVAAALADPAARERVGQRFHEEAHARWPLANIARGLSDAFAEDTTALSSVAAAQ